ncbi:ACT domain-containing protein [Candidatus Woesearchaeota archaeon]|nr:ACT domain-containing protein [Candidatus Woesearchaeota archaeon]
MIVRRGRYAYLKAQETAINEHFFISKDKDEVTVVTEEKNVSKTKHDQEVKWFKLIEIKVSLPFLAKGFLAKVTDTISNKDLNILVISTFSKDYILLREETYSIAVEALRRVGFSIEVEEDGTAKVINFPPR